MNTPFIFSNLQNKWSPLRHPDMSGLKITRWLLDTPDGSLGPAAAAG
jgi:hypothetical protein